jgi:ABC-2 type transport system ATP-binding protein
VDLALRAGEIYALLGRNGAGKTTLIRAVSGRVRLDSGSVLLAGLDPRRDRAARRRLGLAPQETALYAELTVRENLEIFGRLAGLSRRAARGAAERALEWIDLGERAHSRVATLSGGMKRRVNIAAAAQHEPDALLLDEPTVGLDPQAKARIHGLLNDVRRGRAAILLTTHDLHEAESLADRVGVLDDGRLRAEGTLAELIAASFGAQRRLLLALAAPPPAAAREVLAETHLAPLADDELRWSGPIGDRIEALGGVGRRLEQAGAKVAEFKVRAPDLYDVYFALTGKELAE